MQIIYKFVTQVRFTADTDILAHTICSGASNLQAIKFTKEGYAPVRQSTTLPKMVISEIFLNYKHGNATNFINNPKSTSTRFHISKY